MDEMLRRLTKKSKVIRLLWPALAIMLTAVPGLPDSDGPGKEPKRISDQAVEITADELISYTDKNYAEFSGNVAAVQGSFAIRSDALRIYYRTTGAGISKGTPRPDAIEKIVAIGNVVIEADTRRAETDRAEYRLDEDLVVLSGETSVVTDGKNTLTGSKITWFRSTGQINVEGSSQKRVKAVFYSNESLSLPTPGDSSAAGSPPKP